eukprot:1023564-Rhodomonas_salina.1
MTRTTPATRTSDVVCLSGMAVTEGVARAGEDAGVDSGVHGQARGDQLPEAAQGAAADRHAAVGPREPPPARAPRAHPPRRGSANGPRVRDGAVLLKRDSEVCVGSWLRRAL